MHRSMEQNKEPRNKPPIINDTASTEIYTHDTSSAASDVYKRQGPGRNPGDLGSNPTSGSRCMEPASPSACVSASLSLCV